MERERSDEDDTQDDAQDDVRRKDERRGVTPVVLPPPQEPYHPPRREQPPEVVQDWLDPKLVKCGRRAYRTDVHTGEGERRSVYEVVDWGVASDGKCRSVRLKPIDGTRGRTEWVSVRFIRLEKNA